MQISIRTGVPIPAHTLAAKANPEYAVLAEKFKAMAVGDSFQVTKKEAATVRYVANKQNITLASRTLGEDLVGFWKEDFKERKTRKPRTPKAVAAPVANAPEVEDDGVDVEVNID